MTLSGDEAALASIHLQTLAGSLESARATTPAGRPVPLEVHDGRLTPKVRLTPGEKIDVEVVVRRPGALSWALGDTRSEHLTITTPVVHPTTRWVSVPHGSAVTVAYDGAVAGEATGAARRTLRPAQTRVSLGAQPAAGSTAVAVAARTWERLQPATRISWFPQTEKPAAVSAPAADGRLSPLGTVQLTFAKTVHDAIGDTKPTLTPRTPGRFTRPDSPHAAVHAHRRRVRRGHGDRAHDAPQDGRPRRPRRGRPRRSGSGGRCRRRRRCACEQLLAQGGYLPLDWQPSGDDVARTRAAQADASVDAPDGTFTWRFPNTPAELKGEWKVGEANAIIRGAIMKFQDTHHLTVDAFAGPEVWRELLADTIAGKRRTDGYSYVYVHRDTPQLLTLWHDGHTVLTSPGNTGVPAAPTELGTFPVFEHLSSTTMSGTNPDGSHYNDPGVKWVSYFNGGDALHAFNRASFGTPQSLGCVELPEASAKKVWPYTPIGTLVTIEH